MVFEARDWGEQMQGHRQWSRLMAGAAVLGGALLSGSVGCSNRAAVVAPVPDLAKVEEIRKAISGGGSQESAADAPAAQQPTGFATVRGRFLLEGAIPARVALNIDKETEICAPGGKTVYSESLVVDEATQGIRDVVLFADKVPAEWCHESAKPGSKTDPFVFDQKECVFLTHMAALQVSQPLKILNSDNTGHNTNMKPTKNPPMNALIPREGVVWQPKAAESQPFEANCSIHPWMSAWVLVRDNGYFAVTKPDGSFEIANLPAGVPVELKVWQEKSKFLGSVKLDEGSGEKPVTWKRGSYMVTLQPDEQREIVVKVPASAFGG